MGESVQPSPRAPDAPRLPSPLRGVLVALLVNAVPLVGVLRFGWSATNVIVLYWFENVLVALGTSVRLFVHRKLTRKRGYWRESSIANIELNGKPVRAGLVGAYAMSAFMFAAVHGVFIAGLVAIFAQNWPDQAMWQVSLPQIGRGALLIAIMLGTELLIDLRSIAARSFAEAKAYAFGRMGRTIVLHLAIIFGMAAMAVMHSPFGVLYVLIALKTLADVGSAWARSRPAPAEGGLPPPLWMLKAADRLARDKGGAAGLVRSLDETAERERREAIEDEQPMP